MVSAHRRHWSLICLGLENARRCSIRARSGCEGNLFADDREKEMVGPAS